MMIIIHALISNPPEPTKKKTTDNRKRNPSVVFCNGMCAN